MDRKGMNRPGQFLGKRGIHQPMAFDPAFAGKSGRYDMHPEMALPARPVPGMPDVEVRLVNHRQALRLECLFQFSLYLQFHRHDAPILTREPVAP
jgi:hypothetical protein